jgi:hypothetical protein
MNRILSTFVFAAALAACGPVTSLITDGTYASGNDMTLPNATLVIDRAAKTATITQDGGSAVVLNLVDVPRASWEQGCPTNFSSVAIETFTLTPDPAVIGSVSLGAPKLTAGCGLDSADPDSVRLEGGADGGVNVIVDFRR